MATETITAPFVALFSTLLYYDLRVRRRGALALSEHRTRLSAAVALPAQHQLVREGRCAAAVTDPR